MSGRCYLIYFVLEILLIKANYKLLTPRIYSISSSQLSIGHVSLTCSHTCVLPVDQNLQRNC